MTWFRKREKGQALILVAFAIVTLIAFVGLGVDLGLAYVERVRVQRAADAAALAASAELPLESAAHLRALEYLAENDYDCGLTPAGGGANCTNPLVHVRINQTENFADPDEEAFTRIEIDTEEFAKVQGGHIVPNSAVRIRVKVTQEVKMYFMSLLGFPYVPVSGVATAENIKDLDIVLVFDQSGSMEFDTLCYGCWTPKVNGNDAVEYPEGGRSPLPWNGPSDGPPAHCVGSTIAKTPKISGSYYYYLAIEAEEYSALSNDYHRATRPGSGYTYWAMQRNGVINVPTSGYLGDAGAYGRDTQGAYLTHMPFITYAAGQGGATGVTCTWADLNNGEICQRSDWVSTRSGPFPAPRADYGFKINVPASANPPVSGPWYIWVRANGGDITGDPAHSTSSAAAGQMLFWGINGSPKGAAATNHNSGDNRWSYNGAGASNSGGWTWRRLGQTSEGGSPYALNLTAGVDYTLNLWAGSAGYSVDRIVITNYSGSTFPSSLNKNDIDRDNNRTAWACDPCDARFGGFPGGQGAGGDDNVLPRCDVDNGGGLTGDDLLRYEDDLFDDEQPLASTAASAQRFLRKLDPSFVQIGLVRYSADAESAIEMICLKSHGAGCTKNVIDNTMLNELMARNKTFASGGTNIPDGLENAIEMMDNTPPHNGRPSAAHIIILMTDGQPNAYGSLRKEHQNCYAEDLWPYPNSDSDVVKASDCSIYMAREAVNKGMVIYTITLGEGADQPLLDEIANMTGGIHLHAESPDRLDAIFDELYSRIFLRLVE